MKHYSPFVYRFFLILAIAACAFMFITLPNGQQPAAKAASNSPLNANHKESQGPSPNCIAVIHVPIPCYLNPIQRENLLPGTTSWQISDPAPQDTSNYTNDQSIEGYASMTSVGNGQTIRFAVNTVSATFRADIYRLGWYQGLGGRLMQSIVNIRGASQSIPSPDPQTGLVEANWSWTFSVTIPSTWVSGIYLVKLTDLKGEQTYIPFVVKTTRKSPFVLIHTANTDEAYNIWGGTSLYQDMTGTLPAGRAFQVSFDRPFYSNFGAQYVLTWEYPMIRWLEKNGYDVSYISDVDVEANPGILLGHRGILIAGHSEYWSLDMRNNLQAAINQGVNLAAFGANDIYWQIRYNASPAGVPDRIITCYKDAALDPFYGKNNAEVTVQFRQDPVDSPEQTLLGSMFNSYFPEDDNNHGFAWVVSDAASWVFAGTNLQNGDSVPGLVGYEFDSYFPNDPQPATITGADGVNGVEVLASSPVTDVYGNQSIANTTLYTAPSGARVFNAGTIQWSWGLDNWTLLSNPPDAANPATQRITANILRNFFK